MIKQKSIYFLVILLCICWCIKYAQLAYAVPDAQEVSENENKPAKIGIGILYSNSPYIGVDDEVFPVPLIIAEYKNFYIDGRTFGYILKENRNISFSIVGKPRFMGYEASDSSVLRGMQDRDWTLDAGLRLVIKNDLFVIDIAGINDILSVHEGFEGCILVSKEFFKGFLTPRAGIKWQSSKLIDYYYGIENSEVRPGRPYYEGNSALNFVAGLTIAIPIGSSWAFVSDFEYENTDSEIGNSPIVDTDKVFTYVAGVVYRF